MMKTKILHMGAVAAMVLGSLGAAAPAMARPGWDGGYGRDGGYERGDYYRGGDYGRGGYSNSGYDRGYNGGGYNRGYNNYNGNSYNRGRNNYRCRNDGTAGTVIGAIAGGLLGNSVVGRRGDRTAGTIVGAGVGALAGRAIDKGDGRC
ncbi:hypothetical protein BH10PSE13_BH10PSE13_15690 [soil metagenome]